MSRDLAASVRARLLNIAKAQSADFNQVLVRFALERLLYRLSQSAHAERFLLKGALLFTLWYDMPHRPTRDVDLLGFGPSDPESVGNTFREIASVIVDDGITFDPASVDVEAIRRDAGYTGVRVVITGELAKATCKTQIDIGFGDAVTPSPVEALDVNILASAIAATFERRRMAVPTKFPMGLSDAFSIDPSRQSLWLAFLKKNGLAVVPLTDIVTSLRTALQPALAHAAAPALDPDKDDPA